MRASVSYFSPLGDEPTPANADAVFLPGGYPELHASTLARNAQSAASLRAHGEALYRHGSIAATHMHAYWPSNPAFAAALFHGTAF